MPRWGSESDSTTASMIERWKQTAAYEVDDIRGWREDPGERIYYSGDPTGEWGEMPNGFYSRTSYLVGWITTHYPKLDPNPLQDIYIAVLAWHEDHNAKRIPPQPVLFATLERAMLAVNAVEMDIHSRITTDSANLSGDPHENGFVAQDEIKQLSDEKTTKQNAGTAKLCFSNSSSPLSKKAAAAYWGGDMTVKKLTGLMESGQIRFYKLNRQTFIFCRDDVPYLPKSNG